MRTELRRSLRSPEEKSGALYHGKFRTESERTTAKTRLSRDSLVFLFCNFCNLSLGHVDHQNGNVGWVDAADPACLGDRFPDFDSLKKKKQR